MIAVDTSALMCIVLREAEASTCMDLLSADDVPLISAATVAEALVVAEGRSVRAVMERLLDAVPFDIVPVTGARARRVAEAYRTWGKGRHPAGLNFGDCFAYEVAREHGCPLLYVGNDFARTDIRSAV